MSDEIETCWNYRSYNRATRYCAEVGILMPNHSRVKHHKPRLIPNVSCTEWVPISDKVIFYQIRTYTPEMGSMRDPDKFTTLAAAKKKSKSLVGQETQILKVTEEVVK